MLVGLPPAWEISILEIDDSLEGLVEGVLDDFTENVSDCLLNLLVNAVLNVNFGVVDLGHALVAGLLEDHAVALLVHIKHVLRADAVGITCANGVHTLFCGVDCFATSFVEEASCLTDRLFLDIELVAAEVSSNFEDLSFILPTGSS